MKEKLLEVYTDASIRGSNKKDGIKRGFGILFIDPDETETQFAYSITYSDYYKKLGVKYEDRKSKFLKSDQLEMFAFYVAIRKLLKYPKPFDKVNFYVDSEVIYKYYNNLNRSPGIGKIRQPRDPAVNKLLIIVRKLIKTHNINLEVREINGHTKIYGNEVVDFLASIGGRSRIAYKRDEEKKFLSSVYKKKATYENNEKIIKNN